MQKTRKRETINRGSYLRKMFGDPCFRILFVSTAQVSVYIGACVSDKCSAEKHTAIFDYFGKNITG